MADLAQILDTWGQGGARATPIASGHVGLGNGNWLIRLGDRCQVLRRYHHQATKAELDYEHAILAHLAGTGWNVPEPLDEPTHVDGRWYCPTRFVEGEPIAEEDHDQQVRRGQTMAALNAALRPLTVRLGQRPGWRAQHEDPTVHAFIDVDLALGQLQVLEPRLAAWTRLAADAVTRELAELGATDLPVTMLHGDLHAVNVHWVEGRLSGVIDFGLSHIDSRPYELAIARTYRSPYVRTAYRQELERLGWPLSELEVEAIEPIHRAFRVDMAVWEIERGRSTGEYDTDMIERQLMRTGQPRP